MASESDIVGAAFPSSCAWAARAARERPRPGPRQKRPRGGPQRTGRGTACERATVSLGCRAGPGVAGESGVLGVALAPAAAGPAALGTGRQLAAIDVGAPVGATATLGARRTAHGTDHAPPRANGTSSRRARRRTRCTHGQRRLRYARWHGPPTRRSNASCACSVAPRRARAPWASARPPTRARSGARTSGRSCARATPGPPRSASRRAPRDSGPRSTTVADRARALASRAPRSSRAASRASWTRSSGSALVALNAGLEGARLGEAEGRQLGLVSDEVRVALVARRRDRARARHRPRRSSRRTCRSSRGRSRRRRPSWPR